MLSALFDSLTSLTAGQALLLILCAALCGLMISVTAMLTGSCSKSFAISLVALPVIVQVVILMVNGNLGTGVAVMGAFSLIRFRSVPGSSREITLVFLAMAAGLATGMAYAGYGFLITLCVCALLVLLFRTGYGEQKRQQCLRVTLAEDLDYTGVFDDLFDAYTSQHTLEGVKTTNMGSMFELRYTVVLKEPKKEKEFLDALRCRNGNLTLSLTRGVAGKEEL
ncbi:MAG: DUF4956 domain-containing protein [Eubacteriales bacterium]|nr:DUF4956 domain-containing protein [Eubacteriales bacterium]